MLQRARPVRYDAGIPVYRYSADPSVPPLSVVRFVDEAHLPDHNPHIHDFPVLLYIDHGLPVDPELPQRARTGDVYVVAPGMVVDGASVHMGSACGVLFDPAALGDDTRAPWPTWRAHPLLFPFLHGNSGGLLRLHLPPERQPLWENTIAAIEAELSDRRPGFRQAAAAHLTLLLVDVARLADDVVGDLRRSNETVLAEVFDVIEKRFGEQISLRDVAQSVGMTPAYLTTLVRRRTGRTVQDWLTERRMSEARCLLSESDLPINDIARRVGISDPGYFTRVFRAQHRMTPRTWRSSAS
ncbi:helix-turn-helix domain-containing protein [Nocardia sp. SYP-A9097]|uniref:helix-turn-helix transcriptional regulator n=1 Tax=Nocardia sp. SYP-A9097 TaxID=2663237 RepID=UPI00129A3960|nr:AraC family transcriptional regulator [Nocardia sp. SYP-A9097]MRH87480.1 helix-turn-helix domain-containing protein [Nocardia sp. SYP-A9097]